MSGDTLYHSIRWNVNSPCKRAEAMGIRVVRWPPALLCSLQERCSRLQHTLGRGSALLHDPLLVDEESSCSWTCSHP